MGIFLNTLLQNTITSRMNFAKLFHKSNSSIHQIQGNVLECTIEQLRGNKVIVDTGMRASFVCLRDELCDTPLTEPLPVLRQSAFGRQLSEARTPQAPNGRRPSGLLCRRRPLLFAPTEGAQHGDRQILSVLSAPVLPLDAPPKPERLPAAVAGTPPLRADRSDRTLPQRREAAESTPQSRYPNGPIANGANWQLATGEGRRDSSATKERSSASSNKRHPNGGPVVRRSFGLKELPANVQSNFDVQSTERTGAKHTKLFQTHRVSWPVMAPDLPLRRGGQARLQSKAPHFTPKWGESKPSGSCVIGIEEKRSPLTGEFTCSAPKSMEKISKRKLVWTELTKLWRTCARNHTSARKSPEDARISGFILNSVNGGYAVAIAGYIAFLPKSLCINKKVFIGQWRQFAIIGMNPKIANIVVKEIKTAAHQGARFAEHKRAQWNRKMKDRHSKR